MRPTEKWSIEIPFPFFRKENPGNPLAPMATMATMATPKLRLQDVDELHQDHGFQVASYKVLTGQEIGRAGKRRQRNTILLSIYLI